MLNALTRHPAVHEQALPYILNNASIAKMHQLIQKQFLFWMLKLQYSALKCSQLSTMIFYTHYNSVTVERCAKCHCDCPIYHEHEHEKVSLNFELYWNIVCGTGATSVIKGDTGDQGTSDYPHRLTSYSCSSCVACDMRVVWQGAYDMRPVHDVLCLPCVVGAWHEGILHFHGCSVCTMCDMHTVHGNGCVTCVQCMTYVQCVTCV